MSDEPIVIIRKEPITRGILNDPAMLGAWMRDLLDKMRGDIAIYAEGRTPTIHAIQLTSDGDDMLFIPGMIEAELHTTVTFAD